MGWSKLVFAGALGLATLAGCSKTYQNVTPEKSLEQTISETKSISGVPSGSSSSEAYFSVILDNKPATILSYGYCSTALDCTNAHALAEHAKAKGEKIELYGNKNEKGIINLKKMVANGYTVEFLTQ
jgi:hypothetical protein